MYYFRRGGTGGGVNTRLSRLFTLRSLGGKPSVRVCARRHWFFSRSQPTLPIWIPNPLSSRTQSAIWFAELDPTPTCKIALRGSAQNGPTSCGTKSVPLSVCGASDALRRNTLDGSSGSPLLRTNSYSRARPRRTFSESSPPLGPATWSPCAAWLANAGMRTWIFRSVS